MDKERKFLLSVITRSDLFAEETSILAALLEAGLEKLHIRKPAATRGELEKLIGAVPVRWHDRLVIHGSAGRDVSGAVSAFDLALDFGLAQVHGPVRFADGEGVSGGGGAALPWDRDRQNIAGLPMTLSTSVHSHGELNRLPRGIAYAFVSPLFDSISKPGYLAESSLLERPDGVAPCRAIGLGGVSGTNIGDVIRAGWDGAAVLGWLWEKPEEALERLGRLQKTIEEEL